MSFEGKGALVTGAEAVAWKPRNCRTLVARGAKVIGTATSENGRRTLATIWVLTGRFDVECDRSCIY